VGDTSIDGNNSGVANSGDNNTLTQSNSTQNHSGGGDNVSGDKIINNGVEQKHFLSTVNVALALLGLVAVVAIVFLATKKSDGIDDSFNGVSGSTIIIKE